MKLMVLSKTEEKSRRILGPNNSLISGQQLEKRCKKFMRGAQLKRTGFNLDSISLKIGINSDHLTDQADKALMSWYLWGMGAR
jgi:hypothetical protein